MDFEKLYHAYYMKVYSYVLSLSRNRTLAEEITQNTFFKAFTSLSGYRKESDIFTWLCAIARNLYYDELRKTRHDAELDADALEGSPGPEEAAVRSDTALRIHILLHTLEEPYKEVFQLRVFGELSFRQIGCIFWKTENWARVTYHRAKLKIQERMDES